MGVFKFLKNIGTAEGTRESIRFSYQKHKNNASTGAQDDPHSVGLYGALATRYRLLRQPASEEQIWVELLPFLVMPQSDSVKALAEYVVYLERPEAAEEVWLRSVINQSLSTVDETRAQVVAMAIANRVPWAMFVGDVVLQKIRQLGTVVTQDESDDQLSLAISNERPKSALMHFNRAIALDHAGRHEEALHHYDEAITLVPDFEEAWFNKGNSLLGSGKPQESIPCYDHAPSLFQAWCNKGRALRLLGRGEAALEAYDQALRLNPADKLTWLNRGVVLAKLGVRAEALASCEEALNLDNDYSDAWVNKGGVLHELNQYEAALECFERGLDLNPNDSVGWHGKGNTLYDLRRWADALLCFEHALSINEHLEQSWVLCGLCLTNLDRHRDALPYFDKAIALNPRNSEAWFSKGAALILAFEDYREALACFERALQLGYLSASQYIAVCRHVLGEDQPT